MLIGLHWDTDMSNLTSRILKALGAASLVALLIAAGPGLFTSSIAIPAGGTFTTSATINAASGTNLNLNTLGTTGIVEVQYGSGSPSGILVFDGGTTARSSLTNLGLYFPSNNTYYYGTGQYVYGNGGWTGTGTFGSSLKAASDNVTAAYVPPVYNTSGSSLASTTHTVVGSLLTSTNGSCNVNLACTLNTSSVALSGAAQFATAGYCTLSNGGSQYLQPYVTGTVTTSISLGVYNVSTGTVSNGTSVQIFFNCTGG